MLFTSTKYLFFRSISPTNLHVYSNQLHFTWNSNDRNILTNHIATLLSAATCCARLAALLQGVHTCCVLLVQVWNWSNLSQQHPTSRDRVAKRAQHAAPNNVVIWCVERLRSFGLGLRLILTNHFCSSLKTYQLKLLTKGWNKVLSIHVIPMAFQISTSRFFINILSKCASAFRSTGNEMKRPSQRNVHLPVFRFCCKLRLPIFLWHKSKVDLLYKAVIVDSFPWSLPSSPRIVRQSMFLSDQVEFIEHRQLWCGLNL